MTFMSSVLTGVWISISIATSAATAKENATVSVTVSIETFFAPTSAPPYPIEDAWIREIDATPTGSTLRVTFYNLTLETLKDALLRAFGRGVNIRVLVDKGAICNRSIPNALTRALYDEGIPIRKYQNLMFPNDLLHDKFLIIDDRILSTGSCNFTVQGTRFNHENMVLIKALNGDAPFIQDFINQFDRMWNSDFQFSGHEFVDWIPSPDDCAGT